jgi:acetyl esterase/lipase
MRLVIPLLLATSLALAAKPSPLANAKPLNLDNARADVYKTVGDSKLYAYVFEPAGHKPTDKTTAIVFYFGGGWVGGSPAQFEHHCRYLASRGMVAITVEYRTKSSHNATPFDCVADGKSAMRWVRASAAKLGIDPNRIAAGGGSAGGHVAAAVATVPGLDDPADDKSVSCVPNALVLFNPVYDNGPDGWGHKVVADRYKEISPIDNIHPGMPPAIVFLGTQDKLIPVATAKKFQSLMQQAGSRSELMLYEGAGHGFFNYGKSDNNNNFYKQTVEAMDRFLISLGYLTGEPTIQTTK